MNPQIQLQPTTENSKFPFKIIQNPLLFEWSVGQVTHLLWFFVFEVVDVEIKRAGDGETQMRHCGDQSDPGGPFLNIHCQTVIAI